MIGAWIAHWFWTVTGGRNESGTAYGLMSGAGGALPDVLMLTAIGGWYLHRTCHQRRCWRIGKHPVDGTGLKTCRRHHPVLSAHRHLTSEKIAALHDEHKQRSAASDDVVGRLDTVIAQLGGRRKR